MTRTSLLAYSVAISLLAPHRGEANPVPCCQLRVDPTETTLALTFTVHKECLPDAGPPINPAEVLVFKDGTQVKPFEWTVSTDGRSITFRGSLPWSSTEPLHKFEVTTSVINGECRGEIRIGVVDAGLLNDQSVRDLSTLQLDRNTTASTHPTGGCTLSRACRPDPSIWGAVALAVLTVLSVVIGKTQRSRLGRRRQVCSTVLGKTAPVAVGHHGQTVGRPRPPGGPTERKSDVQSS
jgi:hypothetical protein